MSRLVQLLTIVIVISISVTQAQTGIEYATGNTVRIYAPTFTPYNTVDGSPYIPGDSVQSGWLLNGAKRISTKLRYNSYMGAVEYIQGNKLLTPPNTVTEFAILSADTMHFQKGFPPTPTRSADDFYQILFDGRKTKLVKYVFATIKTNTDAMHNDFGKKKFQAHEEYYVWVANENSPSENYFLKLSDGQMKSVVASKKSLVAAWPKKADNIDRYSANQKIKLKSWPEFIGTLRYLDTQ